MDQQEAQVFRRLIRYQKVFNHYLDNRVMPDVTETEMQFYKYIFNWPNSEPSEFNFRLRPVFKPIPIEEDFLIKKDTWWDNYMQRVRLRKVRKNRVRGALISNNLFDRVTYYVGSPEF